MSQDTNSPSGKATPDEQSRPTDRDAYADKLAMPQEDDPAGDGHMWSGKATTPEDRPEDDAEVGAPGHIPTHHTGPSPF